MTSFYDYLMPSGVRHKFFILLISSVSFIVFYLIQLRSFDSRSNNNEKNSNKIYSRLKNDEISLLPDSQKIPFDGEILIHFDLKGAPPKTSYLLEIFPYIKSLGATGVLMEYEDTFPYNNDLEDIRALNAYTSSNITEIVQGAEKHNLTVIPLVQTFGHFEYVLKLDKYKHLREADRHPEVLCPSQKEVFIILKKMIDQVLAAHPRSKYFHIGCDETYFLGVCPKCQDRIIQNKWRRDDLYFVHVRNVAEYIVNTYPGVRPIVWGDKFVRRNEKLIRANRIPDLIDIMLWNYKRESYTFPNAEDMNSYARLFKSIWIAGAFKGATGSTKIVTNPEYHAINTKTWMRFISQWKGQINVKGMALTGWQRYNHMAPLCELLPVAIPSLVLSLQLLNKTDFDYDEIKHLLNCNFEVPLTMSDIDDSDMYRLECDFPGFRIYQTIHLFFKELRKHQDLLSELRHGQLSYYNVIYNISLPVHLREVLGRRYQNYLEGIYETERTIRTVMAEVYSESTIDEWIITYLLPLQFSLQAGVNIINRLADQTVWPRRPWPHDLVALRTAFSQICSPNDTSGCSYINVH